MYIAGAALVFWGTLEEECGVFFELSVKWKIMLDSNEIQGIKGWGQTQNI